MSARKQRKSGGKVGGETTVGKDGKSGTAKANNFQKELPEMKRDLKKKSGGFADGGAVTPRPDRKARASGGRAGASPFTAAHSLKQSSNEKSGQGHEDAGGSSNELSD